MFEEPRILRPLVAPLHFGPKVNKNYISIVRPFSDEEFREDLPTPTFKKPGESPTKSGIGGSEVFDFKPKDPPKYNRDLTRKIVDAYGELPLMGGRSSTSRLK